MQHTETYNLNLIETSDTFSPDPLNQNAQALEDAVEAARAEAQAADAALDQRLVKLEAKRLICGTYVGTGEGELSKETINFVKLGFTPKAVLIRPNNTPRDVMFILPNRPIMYTGGNFWVGRIVENGFEVRSYSINLNSEGALYFYVAFN